MLYALLRCLFTLALLMAAGACTAQDPLPSWNDGASKSAIVHFVGTITNGSSPGYVPAAERIATFDNDSTLWSEQSMYFQLAFALD